MVLLSTSFNVTPREAKNARRAPTGDEYGLGYRLRIGYTGGRWLSAPHGP
jgi:hypothetical protein